MATGEIGRLETDFAVDCTNDHLLSPDNSRLCHQPLHQRRRHLTHLHVAGRRRYAHAGYRDNGPSYLHGWSPDGTRLVYCGERGGQYDIYAISVNGGPETQLTNEARLDDGPEYAPSASTSGSTPRAAA